MVNESEIEIWTVIPYFSNGIDINTNDVKSFRVFSEAKMYAESESTYYDIVQNNLTIC